MKLDRYRCPGRLSVERGQEEWSFCLGPRPPWKHCLVSEGRRVPQGQGQPCPDSPHPPAGHSGKAPMGSLHPAQSQHCARAQSRTGGQQADFSASRAAQAALGPGAQTDGGRLTTPSSRGPRGLKRHLGLQSALAPAAAPGKHHGHHKDKSPRRQGSPGSRCSDSSPSFAAVESGLGRAMQGGVGGSRARSPSQLQEPSWGWFFRPWEETVLRDYPAREPFSIPHHGVCRSCLSTSRFPGQVFARKTSRSVLVPDMEQPRVIPCCASAHVGVQGGTYGAGSPGYPG